MDNKVNKLIMIGIYRIFGTCMLLLLFTGTPLLSSGQDIKADLKKMNAQLMSRKVNFSMDYRLFHSANDKEPFENVEMNIYMWNEWMKISTKYFESLRSTGVYVYINHSQKKLILNPVNNKELIKMFRTYEAFFNVDTMLKLYKKVEYKGLRGENKVYDLYFEENQSNYAKMTIEINSKTYLISKTITYFNKPLDDLSGKALLSLNKNYKKDMRLPRMEIVFSEFSFPKVLKKEEFSISPYVTKNGKKYQAVPRYSAYEFINYITSK